MYFDDVQRLRAFSLVLDLGSMSAAAEALGYTQSAVSQQIAALEREVAMELLDRSQRPLRPTRAGERLRPQAERVLAALAGAEATVDELRDGRPRLRLAAFPSALSSFVPAAVRDLRRSHRRLAVHVDQLETQEAVESLRVGDVDLAVVHHMPGIAVPETTGLQRRPLLTDDLFVVLPEGHRLARRRQVSVEQLRGQPLVLPRRDTPAGRFRSVVEHLCRQAGFSPSVAYDLNDLPAAQAFVAAGIAIVPMHGLTLAALPPGAIARPLVERPAGSRAVEALASPEPSPIVEELMERLADAGGAHAAARRAASEGLVSMSEVSTLDERV